MRALACTNLKSFDADSAGYLALPLGDENFLALVDGEDAVRPRASEAPGLVCLLPAGTRKCRGQKGSRMSTRE